MTRLTICNACQMGDHGHHRKVVQAVPEGMIGGSVCKCNGECTDGRYESRELRRLAKLMTRAARRRQERKRPTQGESLIKQGGHLYLHKDDPEQSVRRYHRRLSISPGRGDAAVHLAVAIDLHGPPPGAEGHERQIAAGLTLTADEAREVVAHIQAVLDA